MKTEIERNVGMRLFYDEKGQPLQGWQFKGEKHEWASISNYSSNWSAIIISVTIHLPCLPSYRYPFISLLKNGHCSPFLLVQVGLSLKSSCSGFFYSITSQSDIFTFSKAELGNL